MWMIVLEVEMEDQYILRTIRQIQVRFKLRQTDNSHSVVLNQLSWYGSDAIAAILSSKINHHASGLHGSKHLGLRSDDNLENTLIQAYLFRNKFRGRSARD